MSVLTPKAASQMAADIYIVKSDNLDPSTNMDLELALDRNKQYFSLSAKNTVHGKSGGLIINKTTGFGIISQGKGAYSDDAFIILRGTDTGYDVLTDLNTGFSRSTSNHIVHLGFNNTFASIQPELEQFFIQQRRTFNTIHCIGHSLGGALATLAAEWTMKTNRASKVNLYTFGCPRVGMLPYVRYFENNPNNGGIFRVFHKTDPVPMIPLWPFIHLLDDDSYLLPSPGQFISPEHHKISQYINKVANDDWKTISSNYQENVEDSAIEKWLNSDNFVSLTANTLNLFNRAISYVIRLVLKTIGVAAQTSLLGVAPTIMDQLTYLLHRGFKAAEAVSVWVIKLITKMARCLGIRIKEGKDITFQFIRYVLHSMSNHVRSQVQKAVDFITQST